MSDHIHEVIKSSTPIGKLKVLDIYKKTLCNTEEEYYKVVHTTIWYEYLHIQTCLTNFRKNAGWFTCNNFQKSTKFAKTSINIYLRWSFTLTIRSSKYFLKISPDQFPEITTCYRPLFIMTYIFLINTLVY